MYQGEGLGSIARDDENVLFEIVVNPVGHELVAAFNVTAEAVGDFLDGQIKVEDNASRDTHYDISEVQWDWGDRQQTAFSKDFTASHTYRKIGEYIITLTLRNNAPAPVTAEHQKTIAVTAKPEFVSEKDETTMPLIPAGAFSMGDRFREGLPHKLPVHTVHLDPFYIDVTEVTNAMYKKFINETGHKAPRLWNDPSVNTPDQSVIGVAWHDAAAYAQWSGKRLPTEAEWEYAARGGLVGKRYPWGDEITHDNANYKGINGRDIWDGIAPVGSFPKNGYGLFDMAGNVWEWCADAYNEEFYSMSPEINPIAGKLITFVNNDFESVKTRRVWRGGAWNSREVNLRVAARAFFDPSSTGHFAGFRCARTPVPLIGEWDTKPET